MFHQIKKVFQLLKNVVYFYVTYVALCWRKPILVNPKISNLNKSGVFFGCSKVAYHMQHMPSELSKFLM